MTDPRQQELVSALLDGELDGAEQAAAEQLLEQDPQARALFDQYSQIAQSIRSLPHPQAPQELMSGVMAELPPAASIARPRRFSRSWVWSASAAASLLLAILVYRAVDAPLDAPRTVAVADLEMASSTPEPADRSAMPGQPFGAASQPDAVALAQQLPAEAVAAEAAELSELFVDGSVPEPGELIERLVQQDGELQLVQYTVVDVARAFDEVQVLLRQQRIRSLPSPETDIAGTEAGNRLVGIFVEASDSQLAEVIQTLSADEDFVMDVSTYGRIGEADLSRDESADVVRSDRPAAPLDDRQPSVAAESAVEPSADADSESAQSGVAYASSLPAEDVDSLKQGSRMRSASRAQPRPSESREMRRRVLIVLQRDTP